MTRERICNEYFKWLCNIVCGKRYSKQVSYQKLLNCLHNIDFRYSIPRDENRANDGIDLRYRFARLKHHDDPYDLILDILDRPCSVFEMMVALSIRCEEDIMDDAVMGDRTGQWFWGMIVNLGLGSMTDNRYDRRYVENVVDRFLDHDYDHDGRGGLFTVEHCDCDMRDLEIAYQMYRYLNTIT